MFDTRCVVANTAGVHVTGRGRDVQPKLARLAANHLGVRYSGEANGKNRNVVFVIATVILVFKSVLLFMLVIFKNRLCFRWCNGAVVNRYAGWGLFDSS